MKNVMRLRQFGHLTETQVITAGKFMRNPESFRLAPTFYRFMREIVIENRPLEQMEKERGWPARSAKGILSFMLRGLEEAAGMTTEPSPLQSELVSFMAGTDEIERMGLMSRFHISASQARLLLILMNHEGECVHKQTILNRLYVETPNDMPEGKIIDVFICKLRKAIADSEYQIETVWGEGYKLIKKPG